jgi:hypothetical protein
VSSSETFKYDPFGRRIYKSSSSSTSIFAYDGDNLIEETNSSGTVVARNTLIRPQGDFSQKTPWDMSGATGRVARA